MLKAPSPLWEHVYEEFADLAARSGLNCVHSVKWDQQTYSDNATVNLEFFQTKNQNPAQQNGTFPATNPFLLTAIGIYFPVRLNVTDLGGTVEAAAVATTSNSSGMIDDIANIAQSGVLRLDIEQRPYGPYPIIKLAPGCGFGNSMVQVVGDNEKQWGLPQIGSNDSLFQLDIPLIIRAQVNVLPTLVWNAAINTSVGDIPIRMYWEGVEARSQVA